MGRELRRVPVDWEHPQQNCPHSPWRGGCDTAIKGSGTCYKPLHDEPFNKVAREWLDEAVAWDNGTHPDLLGNLETGEPPLTTKDKYPFYWQWTDMPPDPDFYRPEWPEGSATAYQVYETVSEGTPVSPVFTTLEQVEDWLVNEGGYSRHAAQSFCKAGWAPSALMREGKLAKDIHSFDLERGSK